MSPLLPTDPGQSIEQQPRTEPDHEVHWADRPIPPMVQRAQAAFRRDRPQLLKTYKGRWVAYNGDWQLAIGRSKTDLIQLCLRRGFNGDEFVVRYIQPESEDDPDWEEMSNI
jgi:hypothetical protein